MTTLLLPAATFGAGCAAAGTELATRTHVGIVGALSDVGKNLFFPEAHDTAGS